MDLKTALATGKVANITETPQDHIETFMSDVYLYKDRVRKVFKHMDHEFFGDIGEINRRREYFEHDFAWNREMSPEIHLKLQGVQLNETGDQFVSCGTDAATDFYIEMVKVNPDDTLIKRLLNNAVSEDNVRSLANELAEKLGSITKQNLSEYNDIAERGIIALFESNLKDIEGFTQIAGGDEMTAKYQADVAIMTKFYTSHPYFKDHSDWSLTIDNHGGNIVFVDEQPRLIDIYPPKRNWRMMDAAATALRPMTDIQALQGEELANCMLDEWHKHQPELPADIRAFYQVYFAQVKAYYYTMLKQDDLAQQYFALIEKELPKLQTV